MCGNRDASSSDRASWIQIIRKGIERAGMDYWNDLDVTTYIDMRISLRKIRVPNLYGNYKAKKVYTEAAYEPDCYIMFGKESAGIPEEILVDHEILACAFHDGTDQIFESWKFCGGCSL